MYGLQAITASNGWEISFLGISIVFTGLILLSLAIGQIHKILALWDNRNNLRIFSRQEPSPEAPTPVTLTENQKISARQFRILVRTQDDPFSLPRLLALAETSGLDKPHTNLCALLESGIITADSKGFFVWNRDRFTQLTS